MPEPAVTAMKKAEQMDAVMDKVAQMEKKMSDMNLSNKVTDMEKKVSEMEVMKANSS